MKRILITLLLVALPICSQAQIVTKVIPAPTEAARSGRFRIYYNNADNYYFLCNGSADEPDIFVMKVGVYKRTTIASLEQMVDMARGDSENRYLFYNGFDSDCVARKGVDILRRTCLCIRDKGLREEVCIPAKRLESLISQMENFEL